MSITERDIFLNTTDFAETVVFTPFGGSAKTLNGLFWSPGEVVNVGGVDIILQNYMIELPSEEVAGSDTNSTVVKNSITYYTGEQLPDGHGFTKINLSLDQF